MNGYIYDGSKSQHPTDTYLKGPLVSTYKHDNNNSSQYQMIQTKGRSFVATIDNVLTPEQCKEIIANTKQDNFKNMLEKYRSCQRNDFRIQIIDSEFASSLWETLEPTVTSMLIENNLPTQPLGFDVSKGEWKLHSLNGGFRINKYTADEKQLFSVQKDAQYCPNGDCRSLLSVLVYLNEEFQGGLTKFYLPKISEEQIINGGVGKDMTVKEEVASFGGLHMGYDAFTVTPALGKAVIFSHNILHESTVVKENIKYILKTEVIIYRSDKSYGIVVSEDEKVDYFKCLNLFRKAQSLELSRNNEKAGDLYERALSIRYCYPMALEQRRGKIQDHSISTWNNYALPSIVWHRIFDFLNGKDVDMFIRAYPEFYFEWKAWEHLLYKNDQRNSEPSPLYVPTFNQIEGCYTRFRFQDPHFFSENEEACIRVVAMCSFYLLCHAYDCVDGEEDESRDDEDRYYTVRYNPETQEASGITLKSLLRDAFLNRPCYGAIYAVMQQDPGMKNIAEDFKASVDRSYMAMRHNAQFVGSAIGDDMMMRIHLGGISEKDLVEVLKGTQQERQTDEQGRTFFFPTEDGVKFNKVKRKSDIKGTKEEVREESRAGGGVLHYKFIRGCAPQGFLLRPNPRNLVRY